MPASFPVLLSSYYLPYQLKSSPQVRPPFSSATAPKITICEYLERLFKYFKCSDECYILSLIYIQRLSLSIEINQFNIHRILLTSLTISAKFFDDLYYTNRYYAYVGGISNKELNQLEIQFLQNIEYNLLVSEEEFAKYKLDLIKLEQEIVIDDEYVN